MGLRHTGACLVRAGEWKAGLGKVIALCVLLEAWEPGPMPLIPVFEQPGIAILLALPAMFLVQWVRARGGWVMSKGTTGSTCGRRYGS